MYRDPDVATQGAANPAWKPGNGRHLRIARQIALGPVATPRDAVRYAYLLSLKGERTQALSELDKARLRFGPDPTVYWSEGWIQLNLGQFDAALQAWQQAEALHGGRPYWVPYSKAIAFIGLGDNDAALAWWEVAQRSQSPHLDTPTQARRFFRYWRPFEQDLLDRLLLQVPAIGPVGAH